MPPVSKDRVADCNGVLDKTPSTVIIKQSIDMPHSVNKKVISTTKNVKGYFDAELPVGTYNIYVVFDGKNIAITSADNSAKSVNLVSQQITSHLMIL